METRTTITRQFAKRIQHEAQVALEDVGERLGVAFNVRGIRYGDANARLKVEVATLNKDGEARTPEVEDFARYAALFGLEDTDFGRTFQYNGKKFKISGIAVRNHKYPVLATNESGKVYKFAAKEITQVLKRSS